MNTTRSGRPSAVHVGDRDARALVLTTRTSRGPPSTAVHSPTCTRRPCRSRRGSSAPFCPGGSSTIRTTTSGWPSPFTSATAMPAPAFSLGNQSGTAAKSVFIGLLAGESPAHDYSRSETTLMRERTAGDDVTSRMGGRGQRQAVGSAATAEAAERKGSARNINCPRNGPAADFAQPAPPADQPSSRSARERDPARSSTATGRSSSSCAIGACANVA